MTNDVSPPAWAERLLRTLLRAPDRDTMSGDLLEAYREDLYPRRGRRGADLWYLRQLAWFVFRSVAVWGALLAAVMIARDALDWWLSPTNDFSARSAVSTYAAIALYTTAGFASAWRSQSVSAGVVSGAITGLFAAVLIEMASLASLAVRHDPQTLAMIRASGGLSEVFVLPVLVVVPGTLFATMGAVLARAWSGLTRVEA